MSRVGIPAIEGGDPERLTDIDYAHQDINDDDVAAVARVLKSDFLTTGPRVREMEERLCELTGAKYAVACSSDTAALHIACKASGLGEGEEGITTPITFAASANCMLYVGARPVFADIDEKTWNIDPAEIEKKITDKTRVVIPVDYTGATTDLQAVREICDRHGLVMIEDAAHSIGTKFNGKHIGKIAHMTTFSFHPAKTITGGEGGAIVTDSEDYYKKLLLYRTHAITRDRSLMKREPDGPWYYEQLDLSMNYRLTDIQAGLIISQLNRLDVFSARRKKIVQRYNEAFADVPQLILQQEVPQVDATRHLYILRLNPEKISVDRRRFFEAMGAEHVICNVHYIPVYRHPYYEELGYTAGLCPKAEKLYDEMLTIPLYPAMSDSDVEDVIRAVKKLCHYYAK
ncbi:MAG: UDP-4-amino-4,6-dideoxy-N-acetyl-beta-L-altrosamine transaminase [Lachnospiraceae bacterium]|nr:UDP-4-amino-4,6-dideoxy-N-acetyl-beta-L-altrosamine transaminase [Lachnospiraceae bacterium]